MATNGNLKKQMPGNTDQLLDSLLVAVMMVLLLEKQQDLG